MIVLDASALLALLYKEPGQEHVAAHLPACCMSTVNLAEVISRFVRDGHPAPEIGQQLLTTSIEFVPFSAEQATIAAYVLTHTHPLGLSPADRACIALALLRNIPVLTSDRAWAQLKVGVDIRVIR